MKQYINKKVKLQVDVNGTVLHYTANITDVDDTHFSFIDKFGKLFTYRVRDVIEVKEDE